MVGRILTALLAFFTEPQRAVLVSCAETRENITGSEPSRSADNYRQGIRMNEIIAYHGSGVSIDRFDYRFTNQGNDQNGSGFYFTTDLNEAAAYCHATIGNQPKLGGDENPTIHVVRLHFENPMDCRDDRAMTSKAVLQILAASPVLDDVITNFGDADFEGRNVVMSRAVSAYVTRKGDCPMIKQLHKLANDFFPSPEDVEVFNRAVFKATGIDAIFEQYDGKVHYVAFFPEQVEIIERLNDQKNLVSSRSIRPIA